MQKKMTAGGNTRLVLSIKICLTLKGQSAVASVPASFRNGSKEIRMSEDFRRIKMDALKLISNSSMKSEVPAFEVGDTVKVHVRIKEGEKYRIQVFEGTVIAKRHGGIQETFTVRRVAHGCGIERVFPVHSPVVDKVEVVRHGKVRRSKLYYLRDRVGKAAKVKEQIV